MEPTRTIILRVRISVPVRSPAHAVGPLSDKRATGSLRAMGMMGTSGRGCQRPWARRPALGRMHPDLPRRVLKQRWAPNPRRPTKQSLKQRCAPSPRRLPKRRLKPR